VHKESREQRHQCRDVGRMHYSFKGHFHDDCMRSTHDTDKSEIGLERGMNVFFVASASQKLPQADSMSFSHAEMVTSRIHLLSDSVSQPSPSPRMAIWVLPCLQPSQHIGAALHVTVNYGPILLRHPPVYREQRRKPKMMGMEILTWIERRFSFT